jgi:hypothetical protein
MNVFAFLVSDSSNIQRNVREFDSGVKYSSNPELESSGVRRDKTAFNVNT